MVGLEDGGVLGRLVRVLREQVPAAELKLVEAREREEVLDVGERLSVRLPRRMVPSWVSEPMGAPSPRRESITPAMNVVDTAPSPGNSTASFPSGF